MWLVYLFPHSFSRLLSLNGERKGKKKREKRKKHSTTVIPQPKVSKIDLSVLKLFTAIILAASFVRQNVFERWTVFLAFPRFHRIINFSREFRSRDRRYGYTSVARINIKFRNVQKKKKKKIELLMLSTYFQAYDDIRERSNLIQPGRWMYRYTRLLPSAVQCSTINNARVVNEGAPVIKYRRNY